MFKWTKKQNKHYVYAVSVHKNAVHIAILRAVAEASSSAAYLTATRAQEQQQWELVVNDDIEVTGEAYGDAIQALLQRYERFESKHQPLQLVLSPALVEQVAIEKPDLPEADIAATLQWTLKDLVSIPAADLITDFYNPAVQAAGAKKINVVAARRGLLAECLAPLHAAEFSIQGIVNADLAMSQWFEPNERLMLVCHTGQESNQLQIISKNQLVVYRELNRIKPISGIAPDDMDELEALALELQRSLDFYTGQLRQPPLAEIVLAVAHPRVTELAEIIGAQLGTQSSVLKYPAWVNDLKAGDYTDLAVLSGLMYAFDSVQQDGDETETTPANAGEGAVA
ncbi:hypothetical protein [Aliidiomarina celeris]|uniref:hypothetical protein n=1 Tax=Aliidiomarina celeris TaxID=2249428 RepID=UPI000DEA6568|nr:hypothetical protein [Aliidiomarina celeris]